MQPNLKVRAKGAGEMATGAAWRLYQSHFHVLITEIPSPLSVRRAVVFREGVYEGRKTVESVEAILIDDANKAEFQKLGVEVLLMSIDNFFVHKMWNDNELSKMVQGGVPFPILSDAGEKGSRRQGSGQGPGGGFAASPGEYCVCPKCGAAMTGE